ncbi:MAG TPA: hypothetical protein VGF28_06075 [Thermoanaerobaculia bacterium]|jgi:hypothetical protein
MPRKRDLIVPIRDRRQRKRYLTLKNFGWASLAFVVLFAGISIRSELRGTGADYGRLFQRQIDVPLERKPVEVVREAPAPVPDQTHADPTLLEPMTREQWLYGDPQAAQSATLVPPPVAAPRAEASVAAGQTRVAIVGGAEGVTVVQRERRKPVLAGGFGR